MVQVAALPNSVSQVSHPWDFISSLLSDPRALATFVIQGGLGFGLGYFSAKAAKYLFALIGIFIIGFLMNYWQIDALKSLLDSYGLSPARIYSLVMTIITVMGVTTILPSSVGFLLGVIVALRK
jgi:hypothetical protein